MRGFKYVEFSRSTAKSNPWMIIREYERLITETKVDCKDLTDKTWKIKIKPSESTFNSLYDWAKASISKHHIKDMVSELDIDVNYDQLTHLVKLIKNARYSSVYAYEKIQSVEEELGKFKIIYT